MDIVEFLLARIADAEEVVRQYRQLWDEDESSPFHPFVIEKDGPYLSIDPAFVLAECKAKRRIVRAAQAAEVSRSIGDAEDLAWAYTHDILRMLALPYADHPDYREEWRP